MTRQDDELVRRYQEASEQEGARPGAHVRDAVRAHAQMVAAAAASATPAAAPAANQTHWKVSALATLAVVGLTGLLMLQFERGTPEERDTAFSHRRTESPAQAPTPPAPAATPTLQPPAEPPSVTPPAPESAQKSTRNSTGPSADAMPPKPATVAPRAESGAERRERASVSTAPALQETAPAAPTAAAAPATRAPLADSAARDHQAAAAAPAMSKNLGAALPVTIWEAARTGQ
ncbi:hypothetical protein, partial [Acidovorax sp.]|uniref:hypothetical protein n=1 Tax=Acidovorax sp. TaxID=1872122 RepID=UPI0025BD5100